MKQLHAFKFPLEVEETVLDFCPLYDAYSYGTTSKRNYRLYKSYTSRRMRHLLNRFIEPDQQATFWDLLYHSGSLIVGDSARSFCFASPPPDVFEIGVPARAMIDWITYLGTKNWASIQQTSLPASALPFIPERDISSRAKQIADRTSAPSVSDPDGIDDDEEPAQDEFPAHRSTYYFVKNHRILAIHKSTTSTPINIVFDYEFTSKLCAVSPTSVLCFHTGLLKRNYSLCRKANMEAERIALEEKAGFLVGSDAKDFPDELKGTGAECKKNYYALRTSNEDISWTGKWNFCGLYRNRRTILLSDMVWRNGFTCRNDQCQRHGKLITDKEDAPTNAYNDSLYLCSEASDSEDGYSETDYLSGP